MFRLCWTYMCYWLVSLSFYGGCYGRLSNTTVIVPKDVPVELPCYTGSQQPIGRGDWKLGNSIIVKMESSGEISNISDGYNITDTIKFALIVKKTQPGTLVYTCRTFNKEDKKYPDVSVSLAVGDYSAKVVKVPRGDKVTLKCPVDDSHDVTWYKWTAGQKTNLTKRLELTTSEITEFDATVIYVCDTKRKDSGELVSYYFTLTVFTNPTTMMSWQIPTYIIGALVLMVVVIGFLWWRRKKTGKSGTQIEQTKIQGPDTVPLNKKDGQLDRSLDHV